VVDTSGTHGLSCRKSAGRLAHQHNAINHVIHRALLVAQIPSRLEPVKLCHRDNRPDVVSIIGSTTAVYSELLSDNHAHMLTTNPYVIVLCLDLSKPKAFDTVRHSTLLEAR